MSGEFPDDVINTLTHHGGTDESVMGKSSFAPATLLAAEVKNTLELWAELRSGHREPMGIYLSKHPERMHRLVCQLNKLAIANEKAANAPAHRPAREESET